MTTPARVGTFRVGLSIVVCSGYWLLLTVTHAFGQEAPRAWSVTRELQIGELDGPAALTRVSALTAGRDGVIYVVQPLESTVRMFDTVGAYLGSIGRRGDGPAEFRIPLHVGWLGDTLWVFDASAQRIAFWHNRTLAGSLRIQPPDAGREFNRPSLIGMLSDGSLLFGVVPRVAPNGRRSAEYGYAAHIARDGSDVRHVARLRYTARPAIQREGSRILMSHQPFDDGSLIGISPDGNRMAVVDRPASSGSGAIFRIVMAGATGDTLYARNVSYRPLRLSPRAIDAAIEIPDERFLERFPSEAAALDAIRRSLSLPDHHPPVSDMVVGADHTVWLRREDIGEPMVSWIVLDSRGDLAGRVALPRAFKLMHAGGTTLLGVEEDELGVPFVVRYRVSRSHDQ